MTVERDQPIHRCSAEEFLQLEHDATERHEFYRGHVFTRPSAPPHHSLIAANVLGGLGNRLRKSPCRVFESNLRISIPRRTLYTYADAGVICGPPKFDPLDTHRHTVLNPTVLIEVLSPSTEAWDRGGKWVSYQEIESLREYVLISSTIAREETFLRHTDGTWIYTTCGGLDSRIALQSLHIDLPLVEIYSGVTLAAPTDQSEPPTASPGN